MNGELSEAGGQGIGADRSGHRRDYSLCLVGWCGCCLLVPVNTLIMEETSALCYSYWRICDVILLAHAFFRKFGVKATEVPSLDLDSNADVNL
jgi:hypothetical protein